MRRSIAVLLFVVLFASSKSFNAQTESLQSGIPVERMLERGQSHSFTITLEAEQFLQLVVNQRGIDVIIRAFAPDGASLGEFDSPNGGEGPEPVSVVSLEAGVYRFEVTPLNQSENVVTGRYEIKVIEQRKATDSELQARKNPELLKARGMALLTEIEDSLSLIRSPLTRIRLQLQIAQILGRANEKTAAKSAAAAAEGVKEYIAGIDPLEENYFQTYEFAMDLRLEVVQTMGQYDVDAALAFLRATRTLATPAQRNTQWDRELYLETSLASQLTSKDPNRAVQLAEESLKKGYSGGLLEVVARLRASEPELASKLAKQIAAKLGQEKLLKNHEAANLAVNLLRLAHAPVRRFQGSRSPAPAAKEPPPLLSEEVYKELFEKTLGEALAYKGSVGNYSPEKNSAQNILNTLKSMTPEMTAYAPSSVAAVQKRVVELNASGDPNSARWEQYQQLINSGTLEESLQTAAGAPSEMEDQLYQQVAQKAAAAGDMARARQIVKDHIVNPAQRQQALSQLEQQAIYNDAAKGKIEEAIRGLNNLRASRERAMVISQIVLQIGPGLKRATAIELLEQARNLVSSSVRAENQEQMTALIQIAAALSRYDSKRAFEIIEPLIDQFNEMTAAALILNGFGQQYFQDGELVLNGSNLATVASMVSQSLGALGRSNFDRAKAGADRLQRPELRINAYMAIAQQAIGENVGVGRTGFRRLQ